MSIDTIGDFLTVIRNGTRVTKGFVIVPFSKMKYAIAEIFKQEGFIRNFEIVENEDKKYLKVFLKYVDGESVIHEIKRVSTPGRRRYYGAKNISPVIGGLGISVLTTNRGLISHKQAEKIGVGGEIICTVW